MQISLGQRKCRRHTASVITLKKSGMDSVWCDIPLDIQQKRLEEQLQIAADLKKPVLLHTKGQEKRIAELLRGFPYHICVHWYSGTEQDSGALSGYGLLFYTGAGFFGGMWLCGGSTAASWIFKGRKKTETVIISKNAAGNSG